MIYINISKYISFVIKIILIHKFKIKTAWKEILHLILNREFIELTNYYYIKTKLDKIFWILF
jgi:hypothetical protein